MKRLLSFLLCMLQLLAGTVEALNGAGGAETTFFYQAYLLESNQITDKTKTEEHRGIAPQCSPIREGETVCSFANFVNYISTEAARDQNEKNWHLFKEIFDNAETKPLVETSRKLRELGFKAGYDQTRLLPKEKDAPSVAVAIRRMRGIAVATKKNKYKDQKLKMIEALELEGELRRADNMRFFIPKLEKEVGWTLETKTATTSDGLEYTTYDVDATAKKNNGVQDLARSINTAAETLRKATRKNMADFDFVIHQGIIREANESLTELRKKCP
ncbi:hypothetical protein N7504_005770 [Penicillium tannophilum]|nr:hypothetical protein N7504_005770 [Penicillium tannophilum]